MDNLVPGYKFILVGLTNHSTDVLKLDPIRDRWTIVDAYGKKHRAINSLRIKDPKTFGRLPSRLQELLEYPVGVSVGYSETVDLIFPSSIELDAFRAISFYSEDRNNTYDMLTNMESPTHIKLPQGQESEDKKPYKQN